MKKTAQIAVRLSQEMYDQLQRLADADRRSVANYVRLVLEEYVAKSQRVVASVNSSAEEKKLKDN